MKQLIKTFIKIIGDKFALLKSASLQNDEGKHNDNYNKNNQCTAGIGLFNSPNPTPPHFLSKICKNTRNTVTLKCLEVRNKTDLSVCPGSVGDTQTAFLKLHCSAKRSRKL